VIAGVDGMPDGWLVALVSGTDVRWTFAASAAEVVAVTAECDAVAVDIPMGLPETGWRACELAAREFLGPARSSVFLAPPRPVLAARSYPQACEIARRTHGKAVSKQLWHILDRIRDWDTVLDAQRQQRIVEAHPECTFRTLGFVDSSKKTGRGIGQRLALHNTWLDAGAAFADLPAGARFDDALDALAVAWTARRWAAGEAVVFGGERDARDLAMRIVR
jgi:predicted RNase H-like nuclease